MKCATCRFWKPIDEEAEGEEREGHCFRYAPRPLVVGEIISRSGYQFVEWPRLFQGEWCGEWEGKDAVQANG